VNRRFRTLLLALAGIVVLAVAFRDALLGAAGAYLVNAGPAEKADLAVVLGGDYWGKRILKAAGLVREGYAPRVLVSGPDGMYGSHECDLAIPFARKAGYPDSYFEHVEHNALSTREEAEVLVRALRQRGARRVLLVTSDYHTRRAGRIFRAAAPDLTFVVVAAPAVNFTPDGWWHSREGQKAAFNEWTKTVADWFGI
jgi:uncharacterized SAM-binding protein YcdF (DUF218 family)